MALSFGHARSPRVSGTLLHCCGFLLGLVAAIYNVIGSLPRRFLSWLWLFRVGLVLSTRSRVRPVVMAGVILTIMWALVLAERNLAWQRWNICIGGFLSVFVTVANIHVRRTLTFRNEGIGRWGLHLNILLTNAFLPKNQAYIRKWRDLRADLEKLVELAMSSEVLTLYMRSPLLENEALAHRVVAILRRSFLKAGVTVNVTVSSCDGLGPFQTGLFRALQLFQRGLNSERVIFAEREGVIAREIIVELAHR